MAILKPWPSGPSRLATGTLQFSKITDAVGWLFQPSLFSCLPNDSPGVPFSTTKRRYAARSRPAGAQHHDIDVAAAAARDEGLGAVQDVMVAAQLGARGQRCRIGAGARLGEAVAREMLHRAELGQEAPALLVVAEAVDHPGGHVVDRDVGRRAGAGRGQLLHDQRRVEAATARCRRHPPSHRCRRSRAPPPRAAPRPGRSSRHPSARPRAASARSRIAAPCRGTPAGLR